MRILIALLIVFLPSSINSVLSLRQMGTNCVVFDDGSNGTANQKVEQNEIKCSYLPKSGSKCTDYSVHESKGSAKLAPAFIQTAGSELNSAWLIPCKLSTEKGKENERYITGRKRVNI